MSREELSNFIYAVEHSFLLRAELRKSLEDQNILNIAKKYGYKITDSDLEESPIKERIGQWFGQSKINPIRISR